MDAKPKDETKSLKQKIAALEAQNEKLQAKALKTVAKESDAFDGYEGRYKNIKTGEIFMLKVLDVDLVRHRKTHLAKNATHFGDYTPEEFRAQFDKL